MNKSNREKLQSTLLRKTTLARFRMRNFRARQRAKSWPSGPYWWKRLTAAQSRELAAIGRALGKHFEQNEH